MKMFSITSLTDMLWHFMCIDLDFFHRLMKKVLFTVFQDSQKGGGLNEYNVHNRKKIRKWFL